MPHLTWLPHLEFGSVPNLEWLIGEQLGLALERANLRIRESQVILGVDSDAAAIRLGLIQRLVDVSTVHANQTAMLQELNCAVFEDCASHGSLVHNRGLLAGL